MSTSTSTPTLSNTHAIHNDSSNTRSMSIPTRPRPRPRPRPRQLLDLPDEILCLILAYCSQDLDFLLWSCPLITAKDQFCHDCYHCSLCHGPLPQTKQLGTTASASQNTRSRRLRGFASSSNTNILSDYNHKSTVGGGNTSSNRVAENGNGNSSTNESIVRKRRRRLAAAEERENQPNFTAHDRAFKFFGLGFSRKDSQKCPHNVQQQWSDHPGPHQRHLSSHHQHSSSFWLRHLPRRTTSLHHHPPLPPVQSILLPTPSASFASAARSLISRRAQNQGQRLIEGGSESKVTVIQAILGRRLLSFL
ncbi:hypothetical protein F5H01DRAFT_339679 [Linnemannia elongata]|nr:hypothetical protein F5H01DRAFT_339679 [Linnemannia elongata]